MNNQFNSQEEALVPVATRFEEFNGEPIRIGIVDILGEKVPVIALSDIAHCTEYPNATLWKLINRDMILKECSLFVRMVMADGKNYKVLALPFEGFIGLMVKINPKRIKYYERQQKVLAFQKWVIPTFRKIRKLL